MFLVVFARVLREAMTNLGSLRHNLGDFRVVGVTDSGEEMVLFVSKERQFVSK